MANVGRQSAIGHLVVAAAVAVLAAPSSASAQELSVEAQIAEAVSPLPDSLRAGASVVSYDARGNPQVLRAGTNSVVCHPDVVTAPGFFVRCHHKALAPQRDMEAKLFSEGKQPADVQATVQAAIKAGTLTAAPAGTMEYVRTGETREKSTVLWVMMMPNATGESTGLSTAESPTAPWLMFAGTPGAHIMMPQSAAAGAASGSAK
jgi:hypothetical protein